MASSVVSLSCTASILFIKICHPYGVLNTFFVFISGLNPELPTCLGICRLYEAYLHKSNLPTIHHSPPFTIHYSLFIIIHNHFLHVNFIPAGISRLCLVSNSHCFFLQFLCIFCQVNQLIRSYFRQV